MVKKDCRNGKKGLIRADPRYVALLENKGEAARNTLIDFHRHVLAKERSKTVLLARLHSPGKLAVITLRTDEAGAPDDRLLLKDWLQGEEEKEGSTILRLCNFQRV